MNTDTPDVVAPPPADQIPIPTAEAPQNGNGAYHEQPPVQTYVPPPPQPVATPVGPTATLSMRIPQAQAARLMGGQAPVDPSILHRTTRRNPQQQKADADYLDELCTDPAAINWFLRVDRYMPTIDAQRNPIPCDDLMRVKAQPAEFLRQNIISEWGGGNYRVSIIDENGDPVHGKRSLDMSINPRQHPPKSERFGGEDAPPAAVPTEDDLEILEIERQNKIAAKLEQSEGMKLKIRESELRRRQKEADIRAAEKRIQDAEGNGAQNSQAEIIKAQIELSAKNFENQLALLKVTQEAEQKRRDEETKHREEMRLAEEKRREDQRQAEEKRRDDQRAADLARMESSNKMFMDGLLRLGDAIKAVAERPVPTPPAPPPDRTPELIIQLATALKPAEKPDRTVDIAIEAMHQQTAIMQNNTAAENKMTERLIAIMNKPAPGFGLNDIVSMMDRGERSITRALELVQGRGGGDEEDATPGTGTWWQQLLQGAAQAALNNPRIADWLIKTFGTPNPSQQQIAQAAAAWTQPGQPMPMAMPPPMQPQQLPQPGQPMPQQMQPPVRPAWQHAVAPQPPIMPAQQMQPQAQVQPQHIEGAEVAQTPEEHLRNVVAISMELCANAIQAKSLSTQWVSDADANWPADFKVHLLRLPSDQERVNIISQFCDPQVINRLGTLLASDATVLVRFYDQLHTFLDMQKHLIAPPPKPAAPAPVTAPAAAPVATVQPPAPANAQPATQTQPTQPTQPKPETPAQAVANDVAAASV